MQQTKITVKVYERLLTSFNKKLETCFIKRDALLNHIIRLELSNLNKDMEGLKLTNPARHYISGELKRLGTKTINVVVDKDTAQGLNDIVGKCNMVRDSFINRLILLLNSSDKLLEILGLPDKTNDRSLSPAESMSTSPLQAIVSIIDNPLFYLRTAIQEENREKLYTFDLGKELIGMSCYIDDVNVPGTEDYKNSENEQNEISKFMQLIEAPLNSNYRGE